jgi:hypothetical protein
MKTMIYYSFLIVLTLLSCTKNNEDAIVRGKIVNKYTNKPIPNLYLKFGVASGGSGIFGNYEKNKYSTTTDYNGKFEFTPNSNDISNTFYISNDYKIIYSDSMSDAAMHIMDYSNFENTYLSTGKEEKVIKYLPSGIVEFFIEKKTINQLDFDTLIISSKYKEQILSFKRDYDYVTLKTDEQFYVEPSQNQKFKIYRVDNGIKTFYTEMEFFVYNFNYGGGLLGITKKEIIKK